MANPLHHIPIVNFAYREITGDQIKPIGSIVGGAIFSGAIGAASGVVEAIIRAETGKDIGENAVAMIRHGERPNFRINAENRSRTQLASRDDITEWNNPIQKEQDDLSLALLSFSDLKQDALAPPKKARTPTYNA